MIFNFVFYFLNSFILLYCFIFLIFLISFSNDISFFYSFQLFSFLFVSIFLLFIFYFLIHFFYLFHFVSSVLQSFFACPVRHSESVIKFFSVFSSTFSSGFVSSLLLFYPYISSWQINFFHYTIHLLSRNSSKKVS